MANGNRSDLPISIRFLAIEQCLTINFANDDGVHTKKEIIMNIIRGDIKFKI